MKIDNLSICSLVKLKDFCDFQIKYTVEWKKKYESHFSELQKKIYQEKINFYNERGFRILVLSEQSKENLKDYVVPKEIRIDVLKSLPNRKDIIQIDTHNCIKYWKDDNKVSVITCYRKNITQTDKMTNDDLVHVHFFFIDLKTGEVGMDNKYSYNNGIIDSVEKLIENFYSKFMVLITYLELTELKYELVESVLSKKRKTILGISNSSRNNIIHIKSNWNTRKIIMNDIHVRGHWRLQPYGIGRSQYKYIYIQPFDKGLTRRLAQKELVN